MKNQRKTNLYESTKSQFMTATLCLMLLTPLLFLGEGMGVRSQNIGINTTGATPNSSALLDVDAAPNNNKGLLLPRMNTAERDAISAPATGLLIFNTDCDRFNWYSGSAWETMSKVGDNLPGAAGTITGTTTVCQGQTGVSYTISSVTNASGYVWTYTGTGFSIASGTNTNAITADFSATATAGNLTVYATNACESGTASPILSISINVLAPAPGANAATNLAATSFDANWNASAGASTYYLDVATDAGFTSFVTGYNNLNVGNVLTYGVTGLSCSTPYYYRVRAGNACGAGTNSNTITATPTTATPDVPTANAATSVTGTTFAANWTAATGATKYYLDVATDAGFTAFVTGYNNLDVGNVVTYSVTGLTCGGTNYYYRVRAANPCGTSASSSPAITVATGSCGPSCGTQVWAAANLNAGTMVSSTTSGSEQPSPYNWKYCYNNTAANCATYGGLYEWDNVMLGASSVNCNPCSPTSTPAAVQGMCPSGYHIPSDLEWSQYEYCIENTIAPTGATTLATFQTVTGWRGTNSTAGPGAKMKVTSSNTPAWDGTNTSGFTALPGGYRNYGDGSFYYLGTGALYWSATEYSGTHAWFRYLSTGSGQGYRDGGYKTGGLSVRCLQN